MKGSLRMNMCSRIFSVLAFSLCLLPHEAMAAGRLAQRQDKNGVTYRLATADDLAKIQMLYRNLSEDDKHKLVVYPEPYRSEILAEAIEKKRIFIAIDPNRRTRQSINIISILKAYVVDDRDELLQILQTELRCVSSRAHKASNALKGFQRIVFEDIYQFDEKLDLNPILTETTAIQYQYSKKQTYIYFGSAYTCPDSRGKYISTKLEKFALETLKSDVLKDIRTNKSERLFYIYGIVAANVESKSRISVFSQFALNIKAALKIPAETDDDDNPVAVLRFFMYDSIKPTFEVRQVSRRTTRLEKLPDDEANVGYGCLIDCPLAGAQYRPRADSDVA